MAITTYQIREQFNAANHYEYLIDTDDDLSSLPGLDVCAIGSLATSIESGSMWIIGSDGEWVEYKGGSGGSGGSGGTTDYTALTNKPSINGVELSGNKTTGDLGITSAPMTEITYSELKALRDGGNLVPGMQYRITDYSTIINGSYDLSVVGAQGYIHYAVSAGHPFDLIVIADDESTLSENARAAAHEGDTYFANAELGAWRLKYKLDNDSTKYAWASASGKGVIIWMEDEFNNRAGYDFKNIQFVRYALGLASSSGDYTPVDTGLVHNANQPNRYGSMYQVYMVLQAYMQSGTYVNPFTKQDGNADYDFAVGANILGTIQMASIDAAYKAAFQADCYYTFDYWNGSEHIDASLNGHTKIPCRENYIELELDPIGAALTGTFNICGLGGSVWETNSVYVNGLSSGNWDNISGNRLGVNNYSNTFGNNCYSNTFENNCNRSTFGNNCNRSTFGNNCYSNTFGNNCYSNTFGNNCYSNTFGYNCYGNTFGEGNRNNEFTGNMRKLHCGDYVDGITATSTQYGTWTLAVKTLENYDSQSGHATLIIKTGYNQETAISTTDGGITWA